MNARPDLFRLVREGVTARQAADRYGMGVNYAGYARCLWHKGGLEKRPSLRFYPNGSAFCWTCGRSYSAVDVAGALLGVSPIDAARTLAADFGLSEERAPVRRSPDELTPYQREQIRKKRETRDFCLWCGVEQVAQKALEGYSSPYRAGFDGWLRMFCRAQDAANNRL